MEGDGGVLLGVMDGEGVGLDEGGDGLEGGGVVEVERLIGMGLK